MTIASKVFKIAHKATRTALSKKGKKVREYRRVLATKLKWAWKTVKEQANEVARTFNFTDNFTTFTYEGVVRHTDKAMLMRFSNGNLDFYSDVTIWMPISANGTEWGVKMVNDKVRKAFGI